MTEEAALSGQLDDIVLPFAVPTLGVRGRIARLSALTQTVIGQHDHPDVISRLIGESLALTALLGSAIKHEGRFVMQAQTDGPVSFLVSDYTAPGHLRAYCRYDPDAAIAKPGALFGAGNMAFTIDMGTDMNRYQGIVPLEGSSLADAAMAYFKQSEQIPTRLTLASGQAYIPGGSNKGAQWRSGGLLIQHLPSVGGNDDSIPSIGLQDEISIDEDFNQWDEASALAGTVRDDELLDPSLPADRLAYRLFHEQGVRAFEPIPIDHSCRCSRQRIESLIAQFTNEEIDDMIEDGEVVVVCEFCASEYRFDPDTLRG